MALASDHDLGSLTNRVESFLEDSTNTKWSTAELEAAIRLAIYVYSDYFPRRAITTVDLTAAGREIDISGIDYRTIERVWWDYDSSDPDHPPHWRDFEVWPGDLLYVNDPEEPASGDTLRIWYTTNHTLDELDSATATTIPNRHAEIIAIGAAGFAAHTRVATLSEQANVNEWAPRNLGEWATAQLQTYYQRLQHLAAQQATQRAGLANLAALDRWDNANDW
jgi:hypothetical protein